MTETVLEVDSVSAGYGRSVVLHEFSLRLEPRRMTCLLGANGAGKTTVLGVIAGWVVPRSGNVRLHGREIARWRTDTRVRAGIGIVPEGRRLFPSMNVLDHLLLARGLSTNPYPTEYVFDMFPLLAERQSQLAATLSGGEQQMLAIARALIQRPAVLLLDEPSLGLAPQVVSAVLGLARQVADAGTPVLLAEQNARLALRLADDAIVLETGRTVLAGSAAELSKDIGVQDAYLGVDDGAPAVHLA